MFKLTKNAQVGAQAAAQATATPRSKRGRYVLSTSLAALLVFALAFGSFSISQAWFTSGVTVGGGNVTTATIDVGVGEQTVLNGSVNAQPGENADFGSIELVNKSTRQSVLAITLDLEGYLKMYESSDVINSQSLPDLSYQNLAYLFGAAHNAYQGTVHNTPYYAYHDLGNVLLRALDDKTHGYGRYDDGWRADHPLADKHALVQGNSVYVLIDSDFTNKTGYGDVSKVNTWAKLFNGSRHFYSIMQDTQAALVKSVITQLETNQSVVAAFGVDSGTSKELKTYYSGEGNTFYVFLPDGSTNASLSFNVSAPISSDLGTGHGFDDLNEDTDSATDSKLNEQGSLFKLNANANIVQGSSKAVTDVYGTDVAQAFSSLLLSF